MSDDRDADKRESASQPLYTPSGGWDFTQPIKAPGVAAAEPKTRKARVGSKHGGDRGNIIRTGVRGTGQTLITSGLMILLFVVYEVWVTNIYADRKQNQEQVRLAEQWDAGEDPLGPAKEKLELDPGAQVVLPAGTGFANLYIPAFGKDYAKTIVEGVDDASLEKGPGHYPQTALPGQTGNFAIAGHRVGKGEPFLNVDRLKAGDFLIVQTFDSWFVYTVLGDAASGDAEVRDASGLAGRSIVEPGAVGVIAPVPYHPDQTPTRALITLTTCHPKYTANQRMIIHGELTRAVASQGDAIPTELGGTI